MSIFNILHGMLGAAKQRGIKYRFNSANPTYAEPAMIRKDKDRSTAVNNQYAEVAYSTKSAKVITNSTYLSQV